MTDPKPPALFDLELLAVLGADGKAIFEARALRLDFYVPAMLRHYRADIEPRLIYGEAVVISHGRTYIGVPVVATSPRLWLPPGVASVKLIAPAGCRRFDSA